MPMCPNEMHRGYISDFFWKQKRQTKEFWQPFAYFSAFVTQN
jgi:hypothetical protein